LPVLQSIYAERGATITEIMIPFSDGLRQTGVVVGLKKAIDNEGREITREMEKAIVLSLIDQEWKEHLREMDDLKQSVQNAVFEQKDPLLIYKFESVELFKRFLSKVNFDMLSFLMKADIPQEEAAPAVQQPVRRPVAPTPELHTNREEDFGNELDGADFGHTESTTKSQPVRVEKVADRNDKVSVQYRDGRVLRDVKYKKVEQDIKSGDCVVIE
ncbi:MAG TPA: preprotein translocase subunit SecA, partial [Dyadobacter sp.]|nr:preprotein translocase subunit SecA [Dyadobacter sp.]